MSGFRPGRGPDPDTGRSHGTPRDSLVSRRIILLTPRRRFLANRFGLGYQLPLGLVLLGGPLADAGHVVRLIDNDLYGWDTPRLVAEVARFRPDIVLLGHTGSTAAHPACIAAARALKDALPQLRIGYGGVYPSYSAAGALRDCPAIDVVVRGEGEDTATDLVRAWEQGRSLAEVEGISWREGEVIRTNRPRRLKRSNVGVEHQPAGIAITCCEALKMLSLTRP